MTALIIIACAVAYVLVGSVFGALCYRRGWWGVQDDEVVAAVHGVFWPFSCAGSLGLYMFIGLGRFGLWLTKPREPRAPKVDIPRAQVRK